MPRTAHTGPHANASATSTLVYRQAHEARLAAWRAQRPRERLRPAALGLALAAAFATSPLVLQANPAGGVAVHGTASMVANGNQLQVTTTNGAGSSHSVINWQSFSIPQGSSTNFQQPSAASTSINRVITSNPSAIFGTLSSNGKLVLVNPAGITVGAGAVVDTAGFTAAAMRMTEDDARAGRLRFNADGLTGAGNGVLSVQGNIIARGGDVVLIAPSAEVAKNAVVESQGGAVALVAGQQVEITGRGLEGIQLQVRAPGDQAVNLGTLKGSAVGIFASTLRHSGLIQAVGVGVEGGKVVLRATDVAEVSGRIEARRMANAVEQGGSITVNAGIAVLAGALDARGTAAGSAGGDVAVQADSIIQTGSIDVSGMRIGGVAQLTAARSILQTADASVRADAADGAAGVVAVRAGADSGVVLSSAQISASGSGDYGQGGNVQVLGARISLQGASISADGDAGGGSVLVGGDRQGQNPNLPNSRHLFINASSQLSASSRRRGHGGTVVLWSDGDTRFFGNVAARGAGDGGNGGLVEVSGKEGVQFGGLVDAAAGPGGANGSLLLDPKNITIVSSAGGLGVLELADPNQESGSLGSFGSVIENLSGNRVLVTDPTDSAGGSNAGAIYVFNKQTGALQSALTGSHANDRIGDGCGYTNGSYCGYSGTTLLFKNSTWNSGAGAWTFFNTAGSLASGVVAASNSLIGTAAGDMASATFQTTGFGTAGLVIAPYYGGGRGAVANADSVTGMVGTLSSSNALVGSLPGDNVGGGGYNYLSGTQWIIKSPSWSSAAGALTLVDPSAIVPGVVSASNSLVGSAAGDRVGSGGMYGFYTVGKYMVSSPGWGGGKGAFTVVDLGSFSGTVSAGSSLTGNVATDGAAFRIFGCDSYAYCGNSAQTYYSYDSFLLLNTNASGTGSLTRLHPGAAYTGAVSATNSLVGSTNGDFSSAQFADYGGGAYGLLLPNWNQGGSIASAGALVFGHNNAAPLGAVGSGNAIVGTATGDLSSTSLIQYGSYDSMPSGKLLLVAPNYGGGVTLGTGAVAVINLPDGNTIAAASGTLSSSNALVGSTAGDHVGSGGVDTSQPGYWMIRSPKWNNGGSLANAGAVTFMEPASITSLSGSVSGATNSWVGGAANDQIGSNSSLVIFSNDNGLLVSRAWGGGKGAITPIADLAMPYGTISSANSYVGTTTSDGAGLTLKTFDDYGYTYSSAPSHALVSNSSWNGSRGAVTYIHEGFGTLAPFGAISALNSIVGSTANDQVGSGGIVVLPPSSIANSPTVILKSPNWNKGGTVASAGAITLFNAAPGAGVGAVAVGDLHSIYGNFTGDLSGSTLYTELDYPYFVPSGRAVLVTPNYNNGKGGATFFDVTNPLVGATALSGLATTDRVGSGGLTFTSGNAFLLKSPSFGSGAGALTYLDASSPPASAFVGTLNSLVGSSTLDNLGGALTSFNQVGSKMLLVNQAGNGAIYVMDTAAVASRVGVLDSSKGLVGSTVNDLSGAAVASDSYSYGKFFVRMPNWDNTTLANAGAIVRIDTSLSSPPAGTIGSGNALVGASAGDAVGSVAVSMFPDGYLIRTPNWSNGTIANAGALTFFGSGAAMPTGPVSTSNSLVGLAANDLSTASASLQDVGITGKRLLVASNYDGGKGAIRMLDFAAGLTGTLYSANALVGSAVTDHVGSNASLGSLGGTTYLINSPSWGSGAGGVTVFDAAGTVFSGVFGASNSLVGSTAGDAMGGSGTTVTRFANGKLMFVNRTWGGSKGSITLVQDPRAAFGVVDASTSLVGAAAGDGSSLTVQAFDDNGQTYAYYYPPTRAVVYNPSFGGNLGMVTMVDSALASKPTGVISAANSLVGSTAGDRVGSSVDILYGTGIAVRSPSWSSAAGALTFSAFNAFRTGAVSSANSLVGAAAGDRVGYNYLNSFSLGSGPTAYSGLYEVQNYAAGGMGAVTFIPSTGLTGVLSAANSVMGTVAGSGGYASITAVTEAESLRLRFGTGSGRVVYADPRQSGTSAYSGGLGFADNPGADATIAASSITAMTNAGTGVTLQANNDIVVNAAITSTASTAGSVPGQLKLEAGRSLLINANINMNGGDLALIANSQFANASYRDAGVAQLRTASGVTLSSIGGFIGALMDSGTGGLGGSIELGNVLAGGLELRNWSTASGAGIRQTAGASWQTSALRMETRSADGSIGTLNTPISFSASWLAARTRGGPMDLSGTGSSLAINDVIPSVGIGAGGGGSSGSSDPRSFDQFYGLTTSGLGSVALRSAGDLSIQSRNSAVQVAAQNLSLQARSITLQAFGASVNVVARGALELRSAGDITVQAGTVAGAYASVVSAKSAFIVAGGRLGLKGGLGNGAYALIDPTDAGSGMTVNVGSVNIQGGGGIGAYGALASAGGPLNLTAASITLVSGDGNDADAVILAPNAKDLLASYGGICASCTDLGSGSPLGNGRTESGFAIIGSAASAQRIAADLQTQQSANLLDVFEALWKKEKAQSQGDIVVDGGSCN